MKIKNIWVEPADNNEYDALLEVIRDERTPYILDEDLYTGRSGEVSVVTTDYFSVKDIDTLATLTMLKMEEEYITDKYYKIVSSLSKQETPITEDLIDKDGII